MDVPRTSDHIQIKIKIQNPSQEPPVSSKVPNKNIEDMDVLCIFKTKIESQIWQIGISKPSDHIQIKIKMPNPSQEPPAPTKAPNQYLKDIDALCIFKIKIQAKSSILLVAKTCDHI